MDTEQQVRLNFLEEAEEYFERLEAILLDLATTDNRSQPLNEALRAAHSIKGSAGMMGFMLLSRVAHRLEDFLKILQARQIGLDEEIETLLLRGVDCLRHVKQLHYDGITIDEFWWETHAEPIFVQLRDRLGDLTDEDENRLLSSEENVDIGILMLTSGVEAVLEQFERDRGGLEPTALRPALRATATKLLEFGFMGQVDAFVALCESVQGHCRTVADRDLPALADAATSLWWQSHALVSLGRIDQLPSQLDWVSTEDTTDRPITVDQNHDHLAIDPAIAPVASGMPDLGFSLDDLSSLQANLAALTIPEITPESAPATIAPATIAPAAPEPPAAPIAVDFDLTDLAQLQATIAGISLPDLASHPAPKPKVEVPVLAKTRTTKNAIVRVPLEQFRQINTLFSSLILERNSINLRLEQFQSLMLLLRDRMHYLEGFNQELRQWYDRAALDGLVTDANGQSSAIVAFKPQAAAMATGFDSLEMDRYSNLHLLAQEQMETIVKLQEVIADLDLTTQEMQQANSNLNYTSRSLQTRITRAQMRPFSDLVGKFPRVVRDLAVKYGKQVNLKIVGESTLFERVALDALSDPLNHLLRNAFDHGIEDPQTRLAQGKPAEGTITLRALQRGNKAIVTIQDDGKGINFDKIRNRVRQHGIPEERVMALSRQELLDLIFEAGFSTADKVTELSGRGVGMDVVRSNLKEIQGDVTVETTPGQGSKFIISIPLTLSILRVMILEAHGLVFAIPIEIVKELTAFEPSTITARPNASNIDQAVIAWQDQLIPLAQPEQYWQFQSAAKPMEMQGTAVIEHPLLLVVGEEEQCYGLQIQRFWGEQEVGIRPVTSPIALPAGFSGVTVLGDGRIIPMVDPIQLFNAIANQQSRPAQNDRLTFNPPARKATKTILVVDDSVHARRYLAISLEKAGYQVEQAKDGQEAVDRLLGGLKVEAVICDIEMPRLDGYGVLSEIKRRSAFKDLPMTMLTSRSSEKHRRLAMSLGATAYFSKPYNEQELLQTLATMVN
jgi:two-component system, chemotaxis family, sensor histidine kinase and response regulator PixL